MKKIAQFTASGNVYIPSALEIILVATERGIAATTKTLPIFEEGGSAF